MRRMVDGALGLSLRNTPAGATWTRAPDSPSEGSGVYELAWTGEDLSGKPFFRKWVITVDPVSKLPQTVEEFWRVSTEHEWDYEQRREYQYLTDDEMAAVMDR
jgi:hypothetical protein